MDTIHGGHTIQWMQCDRADKNEREKKKVKINSLSIT